MDLNALGFSRWTMLEPFRGGYEPTTDVMETGDDHNFFFSNIKHKANILKPDIMLFNCIFIT